MKSRGPYLFLQGPSSPLFVKIAGHLEAAGHLCHRINLNVGDQIFWRRRGAVSFRGGLNEWGPFLRRFLHDRRIKTIILLGEERPYHKEAVKAAYESGVTVVAIEMGYLRPDWVTVELDGLSSNSRFPKDKDVVLKAAAHLPEPDWTRRYSQTFFAEALYDLAYYLPTIFFGFLYPRYQFHGIFHPLKEYAGWVGRFATGRRRRREARRSSARLLEARLPWVVFPLQLETDYQIRAHSPFNSQKDALALVMGSFARSSDPKTILVFKVHPLDNGLINWKRLIQHLASTNGVSHRVVFIDGGDLAQLFAGCNGVVTINSTAALSALREGVATKVLGVAVFDVPGITHQGSLDEFWSAPSAPVSEVRDAFFRLLAAAIHVRGNFYSRDGVSNAARAIATRLIEDAVNKPGGDGGRALRTHPVKIHCET